MRLTRQERLSLSVLLLISLIALLGWFIFLRLESKGTSSIKVISVGQLNRIGGSPCRRFEPAPAETFRNGIPTERNPRDHSLGTSL